jgi:hypothetical protein
VIKKEKKWRKKEKTSFTESQGETTRGSQSFKKRKKVKNERKKENLVVLLFLGESLCYKAELSKLRT